MTATTMSEALHHLELVLSPPARAGVALGNWRWAVRQRMAAVRETLIADREAQVGGQGHCGTLMRRFLAAGF